MNNTVLVRNRHQTQTVNCRLLRSIAQSLLRELGCAQPVDLAIYLLAAPEITRLNESFLRHAGSTDVLAFDYADPSKPGALHGEIFVCLDEARRQAAPFRTNWQTELVRYMVHGVLHLAGYDDKRMLTRRKMKQEENRLLKRLAARFKFSELRQHLRPGRVQHSRSTKPRLPCAAKPGSATSRRVPF